jgi:catechol 2,3-dioxygenase-like lactoylglutathione lyase family enzyme
VKHILSHVDLRVRDRAQAVAFYDVVLGALGHVRSDGKSFVTFASPDAVDGTESDIWFGMTVDPAMTPGLTRIAFAASSRAEVERAAAVAREAGALNVEGPDSSYGPEYYAVFFEDPDGNRLEVCCLGPTARPET